MRPVDHAAELVGSGRAGARRAGETGLLDGRVAGTGRV